MGVSGVRRRKRGEYRATAKDRTKADSNSAQRFFFSFSLHWMEQYPGASLRIRLVIVIIRCPLFLSLDATVDAALSSIVTYDARNNSRTSVHERRRCRCGGCVIAVSCRLLRFPLAREGWCFPSISRCEWDERVGVCWVRRQQGTRAPK